MSGNLISSSSNSFTFSLGAILLGASLSFQTPATAQSNYSQVQQDAINATDPDRQPEPADLIFQAHLKLRAAEKAEEITDYKTSWKNYSSALKYYQTLKLTHPLWKPDVVNFRIKDTSKRLDSLKPKLKVVLQKEQSTAEGIFSGKTKLTTDQTNYQIPSELLQITNKIKHLNSDLKANRQRYERERTMHNAKLLEAEGQIKLWKQKTQANPEIVSKLEKEIERTKAFLTNNKHYEKQDQIKIEKQITNLKKDLSKYSNVPLKADLERYKDELGKRTEELKIVSRALLKSERQADSYKEKMEEMTGELAKAQAENQRLNDDLKNQASTGSKVVKGLMKQLEASKLREDKLSKELKITKNALAELTGKLDEQNRENKELQQRLEDVTLERDRLNALVLESPDKRIKAIAKQNIQLMENLRDARETLSRVTKDQGENVDRMHAAERDLAIAKKRILDFQEQNRKDTQRIASLQKELTSVKSESSQKLESSDLTPIEREENAILRATAKKYERREAFIRKKWELVKRYILEQNDDPEAVALVQNALTEDKLAVTDKEKEIMNKVQQADVTLYRADGVERSVAENTIAQSEQEVEAIHRVVDGLIQRNRLGAAKDLLDEANDIIPNKFSTLMNLGTVYMKMRNLDQAEQHFKDGIVMKRNNPSVHYLLGLCQYRKGQAEIAQKSLKFSLDLDPIQEKANYYLGVIAGNSGKIDQAEDYFKKAIRINPELAEAYMALSINCLMKEETEAAQDYYQEALEKGMKPLPSHAKRLGLPH